MSLPANRRVVAYVPDLMDRSKIAAAAPSVVFVRSPAELIGADCDVVVVDLSRPGVIEVAGSLPGRRIGFGSHVDRQRLASARAAGFHDVMVRSEFFAQLGRLLGDESGEEVLG
jgi:hypothetical protein